MKYKDFRNYKIVRNCKKEYKDYKSYLPNLADDFKHRCAYCNTHDKYMSQGYSIDHFIPREAYKKANLTELEFDYNNLMYCCPKCNSSKCSQYSGNIHDGSYKNEFFYNPVDIDYNDIFYRNDYGGISSEDVKGKDMIIRLKLFSPIYNFSFLIEEVTEVVDKLEKKIQETTDLNEKEYYSKAYIKLNNFLRKITVLFNCNYYNNSVKMDD